MFTRCMVLIAALNFASSAFADDVGNGHDLMRELFSKSRQTLSEKIENIRSCSWDGTVVSHEVRNWILTNRRQLKEDISDSRHSWITDLNTTCAMTMVDSKSPIVFSFPACRGMVTTLRDAERILAHESVHHFGISDESFPTDVAEAILVGNLDCQIEIPEDVFDEASCPGEMLSTSEMLEWFDPAQIKSKDVVNLKAYQKSRNCHTITGCTPWEIRHDSDLHWVRYYNSNPTTKENVVRAENFKNVNVNFYASSSSIRPMFVSSPDGAIGSDAGNNGFTGRTSNGTYNLPSVLGKITRECARFTSIDKSRIEGNGTFSEWHTVYFGKTMNPH